MLFDSRIQTLPADRLWAARGTGVQYALDDRDDPAFARMMETKGLDAVGDDGARVADALRQRGIEVKPFDDYGWPDKIELALVDAVSSIRARYGDRAASTGVIGRVRRYEAEFGPRDSLDDLGALALRDERLESIVGRSTSGGRPKAEIMRDVAARLVDAGVRHASDLSVQDLDHRQAWVGCRGLGHITWDYFGMLLGQTGVKADTMVVRFVDEALSGRVDSNRARSAVRQAAEILGHSHEVHLVDHAIWLYQRQNT